MDAPPKDYVLVLDVNAPWVRSLFVVLPGVRAGERTIRAWRVNSVSYLLSSSVAGGVSTGALSSPGVVEKSVVLSGWTCCECLSTWQLVRSVRGTMLQFGKPAVIVYTLPQYAGVAEHFADCRQVYYAYDSYRFYSGWDAARADALEARMLAACTLGFGVSRQIVDDLQRRVRTPVFYSPNAVSASFVHQLRTKQFPPPAELADVPGKIVGCIGQLSATAYDWFLIGTLAGSFPNVTFAFVGPFMGEDGSADIVRATLARNNVRWLGARPHEDLPRYLNRFDVCLSPLRKTKFNHRRSLLRLYDYLATDQPILSTGVREAYEHAEFIEIGDTVEECINLLRRMLQPAYATNVEARQRHIMENTWEKRAEQFWNRVAETKMVSCSELRPSYN